MAKAPGPNDGDFLLRFDGGIGLRVARDEDAKSLSNALSNKNVWNNLRDRIPHPYTEDDSMKWNASTRDPENWVRSGRWTEEGGSQGEAVPTHYAITVNNEAVGFIGADFGSDVYFRTAEVGYWLGEDHWGKGVMSKVIPAFVRWVWETFDILVRLNGETNEANVASASLLKKSGFVCEGIRPNSICKNGKIQSTFVWGALRPT